MSENVVEFPNRNVRQLGNGAREALIAIASVGDSEGVADWILAELWARGFKVVPLDDTDS